MTWMDGFKVRCNECGEERTLFYDPDYGEISYAQLEFSDRLREEGWTHQGKDHHLCPDCANQSQLEKKIESALEERVSWLEQVISGIIP